MGILFTLLFLVSLILLVVGLIRPSALTFLFRGIPSRKKAALVFGLLTFVLFVLVVVFAPSQNLSENASKERQATTSGSIKSNTNAEKPAQDNQTSSSGSVALEAQTKTSGCVAVNSLPDKACTPGAVFATTAKDKICVSGYSSSVRNVSESTKEAVYREYGITSHTTGQYEVDHLISLELGGSNDISNLWPESASPVPGFHEKDTVENKLHSEVCNGTMSLTTAQTGIASKWLQFYIDSRSN
jgi:hypothetical protein